MSLADVLATGLVSMTPGHMADIMLQEDQARRRAMAAGRLEEAARLDQEIGRLAALYLEMTR